MNWSQLMNLFDGQGVVFWSAVTAVTLGLTMLSVSIVFQARKVLGNRTLRLFKLTKTAPAKIEIPAPQTRVTVTDGGYRAEGFVPAAAAPAGTDPLLNSLLARLQSSADRLERIHVSLGQAPAGRDSVLKPTAGEVDYVYQAGRA